MDDYRQSPIGVRLRRMYNFYRQIDFNKGPLEYLDTEIDIFEDDLDTLGTYFLWPSVLYFFVTKINLVKTLLGDTPGGISYHPAKTFAYGFLLLIDRLLKAPIVGRLNEQVPSQYMGSEDKYGSYITYLFTYATGYTRLADKEYLPLFEPAMQRLGELNVRCNGMISIQHDIVDLLGQPYKFNRDLPKNQNQLNMYTLAAICDFIAHRDQQRLQSNLRMVFTYIDYQDHSCALNREDKYGNCHFQLSIVGKIILQVDDLGSCGILSETQQYDFFSAFHAQAMETFHDRHAIRRAWMYFMVDLLLPHDVSVIYRGTTNILNLSLARVIFWSPELVHMARTAANISNLLYVRAASTIISSYYSSITKQYAVLFIRSTAGQTIHQRYQSMTDAEICPRRFAMNNACECANFADVSHCKVKSDDDFIENYPHLKTIGNFPIHPHSVCALLNREYFNAYVMPYLEAKRSEARSLYGGLFNELCNHLNIPTQCYHKVMNDYVDLPHIIDSGFNVSEYHTFYMPFGDPRMCSKESLIAYDKDRNPPPPAVKLTLRELTTNDANVEAPLQLSFKKDRNKKKDNRAMYNGRVTRSFAKKMRAEQSVVYI